MAFWWHFIGDKVWRGSEVDASLVLYIGQYDEQEAEVFPFIL